MPNLQKKIIYDKKERKIIREKLLNYMDKKDVDLLINHKKYKEVIHNFIFWFEESEFLKVNQNELSLVASQKISIEIVMLISLIHAIESDQSEQSVHTFFKELFTEEKFLIDWIIDMESPWDSTRVIKGNNYVSEKLREYNEERNEWKRKLIKNFVDNKKEMIEKEFRKRIKYLFALRSQIVHRGEMCFSAKFTSPRPKIITSAIVEEYPRKQIQKMILLFHNCKDPFDSILKELFLSVLIRKIKPNQKRISCKIKENLNYIVREDYLTHNGIIDDQTRKKLEEKINIL
ncbi:hypothetical protein DRP43_03745 [candidate division TA06 bacterium]|uniref:Uncharacterized protein n=1 Tax=candidate division TA06 bacterium TaxID=2250710 RepID=A0A660SJE0_UNCT6|nr:MAG: hypothetical protein DRP43_03745 [candidate division TA06 bacterium]